MTSGQTTVLGLLLLLLALEAVRNQAVLTFLKNWLGTFKTAVNSTASGGK